MSLNALETQNYVGADHCQEGTNKNVYAIYVCEGTPENPIAPIEYRT